MDDHKSRPSNTALIRGILAETHADSPAAVDYALCEIYALNPSVDELRGAITTLQSSLAALRDHEPADSTGDGIISHIEAAALLEQSYAEKIHLLERAVSVLEARESQPLHIPY
ncbi:MULTISPECIES: hypothetical protein [Microbacterium]|uniref:hypothetical protein n=1 Tax=Microbacterium TaxID=33882 RepID=UPI002783AD26|nr:MULTISPECIES: hypothetical protein [Microbacterium]MDQ1084180.1 hypothetical protein [Microbacterium sp. SORGH_AS_0344]MDQ1170545.1 hypothetical protein [Microbacterium proteolyticum]